MAYTYDVFLSYNHKFPHREWVEDIFYPLFRSYLEDALGIGEIKVFIGSSEIQSNDSWQSTYKHALLHSKIMVSILSPSYFNSEWCKKEFAIMDYRQRQLGFLSYQNPNGLIIPIKIFGGDTYPDYVKDIQIEDFCIFFRVGLGMRDTTLYIDFQSRMQSWIYDVAYAYNNVPPWSDHFANAEWLDKAFENLDKLNSSFSKKPPVL